MRFAISILILTFAHAAAGELPRWPAVADEETIHVLTRNEDGTAKQTIIWLVVVDEQGYIRSRGTSWRANMLRNPDIALRIAGAEYAVQTVAVQDEAHFDRVNEAFTGKYGVGPHVFLAMMRPFLGGWNIYRVIDRD